ncbi:MAG: response regulator [Actinomycetota bacterium]|nr:MAG: response regulator [Actinomycetota bacterium]MDO8950694.1 response regulator [Actinomycetota bacterium]MDP3630998.1 response regulator [Actinomycetota bacterium]
MTTCKILVADDNLQIRMLVGAALRSLGHEIIEAVDGEAALATAIQMQPDLVLLDVNMPKLDGFEVLAFLRKRPETADVKVIMLTTAAQQTDLKHGADLGCNDYITKPFQPKVLRDTVEAVLATA